MNISDGAVVIVCMEDGGGCKTPLRFCNPALLVDSLILKSGYCCLAYFSSFCGRCCTQQYVTFCARILLNGTKLLILLRINFE